MFELRKLSDDMFEGNHPNSIYAGDVRKGHYNNQPEVGVRFYFGTGKDHVREHLRTSTVTEILGEGKFKTLNSTYVLINLDEK
jgi:hypothetical protein